MSESSPGRTQRLLNSSIGQKLVMGATGVILVGFVLVHMAGNLQVYIGSDTFNHYAATLQGLGPLLWVARIVLLVATGLHIWAAVRLTQQNWNARPHAYAGVRRFDKATYAGRFMRASGVVVLAFIVFHILHFTVGAIQPDNHALHEVLRGDVWVRESSPQILAQVPAHMQRHDAYSMFVLGFQNVLVSVAYIVANILLGRHLGHGIASMLATLGLAKGASQRRTAERIGLTVAMIIMLGNISFPIAVLSGVVHL